MGNMFQCKIDEIFNDMPNIFGITNDILVIGCDNNDTDHNETVCKVLQRCKEVNLRLNKEKCHFRCTYIPFFGEVILRREVLQTHKKLKSSWTCHHLTTKESSNHSWTLLTIWVNFLQVQQWYVIHSKN